jgi:hypothetical protein
LDVFKSMLFGPALIIILLYLTFQIKFCNLCSINLAGTLDNLKSASFSLYTLALRLR